MNRARLTLIALVVTVATMVAATGCGGDSIKSAFDDEGTRAEARADAAVVRLASAFDCFDQERWQMVVSAKRVDGRPITPLISSPQLLEVEERLPRGEAYSAEDDEAVKNMPTVWFYGSAREAAAALPELQADRALRGGTKPERVGRAVFWWSTTTRPKPDVVETLRKCVGLSWRIVPQPIPVSLQRLMPATIPILSMWNGVCLP